MTDTLNNLMREETQFVQERAWEQFHSPKNLASALNVEAGELLEHFQWMLEAESKTLPSEKLEAVSAEIADVVIALVK